MIFMVPGQSYNCKRLKWSLPSRKRCLKKRFEGVTNLTLWVAPSQKTLQSKRTATEKETAQEGKERNPET